MEWLQWAIDTAVAVGKTVVSWFINKDTNDTNTENVENTNETNKEINDSQLDYQKEMTLKQWERDDTAHQREVADLEAAGLSPLASTTGSANGNPLSAPSPIAMQAPQIDTSAFINSMLQMSQLQETKRHNLVQEGQKDVDQTIQMDELALEVEKLNLENKKVEETIKYNYSMLNQMTKQLTETKEHNRNEEELKKLAYMSENYWNEINKQTGGNIPYKDYYDVKEYESAMQVWTTQFQQFITTELAATSSSSSSSSSASAGGGASVAGTGGNISVTSSSGEGQSSNISQKQEALMKKWYASHPMPVYHQYKYEKKAS